MDTMQQLQDNMSVPEVSERSKKTELIKAYKTLLKRHEEAVHTKRGEQAKRSADEQIVEKAGSYTADALTRNLESLKSALTAEAKKFEEISHAIAIQQLRLKELHDIEIAATSLEDLIKAQEEKKELFEEEYERIKVTRKHEEEEYQYALQQQRKKEDAARQEREETMRRQEEEFKKREQEFQEYKRKVEASPLELQQAIEKTKEETTQRVRAEMQTKADLIAREVAGEKKVLETRIAFLEETIAKQREENATLKRELEQAVKQVQSIAEKAIEGSSGKQTLKAVSDIAMQQAGRASQP